VFAVALLEADQVLIVPYAGSRPLLSVILASLVRLSLLGVIGQPSALRPYTTVPTI
jgi:hypothetical protein